MRTYPLVYRTNRTDGSLRSSSDTSLCVHRPLVRSIDWSIDRSIDWLIALSSFAGNVYRVRRWVYYDIKHVNNCRVWWNNNKQSLPDPLQFALETKLAWSGLPPSNGSPRLGLHIQAALPDNPALPLVDEAPRSSPIGPGNDINLNGRQGPPIATLFFNNYKIYDFLDSVMTDVY